MKHVPRLINVAGAGIASQSSNKYGENANQAIDGDTNSDYLMNTCSHTDDEQDPWWKVDLGTSYPVYDVIITNRQDCHSERILGTEVRVGDNEDIGANALCGEPVESDRVSDETLIFECDPALQGRYVSIQLVGRQSHLHVCEVAVLVPEYHRKFACETLIQRLEPMMVEHPKGSWEDWVVAAFGSRINLSAYGHYIVTGDPSELKKKSSFYFAYGCACSEVEVDCLTGDFEVLRTNIVMDCGDSLSPAVDIGQIEGGFMQGYGFFTMEEERRSPKNGELLTLGPGLYKIPSVKDIPQEFNVHLLKGCPNNFGIYSSKNTGEPPIFLGSAVYFAIKDALYAARRDAGIHDVFRLDPPATVEKIRMACVDQFTKDVY
ncbi:xanthine dehydrogenase/oxidase-like [Glandiceps talaboti]